MPRRRSSPARQAAAIGAVLLVGGCHYASSPLVGFGHFIADTHTFNRNPNGVGGHDENTLYSQGRDVAVSPLLPEGGNIWPGPPPPVPTLTDIEKQQNQEPLPNLPGQEPIPSFPGQRPVTHGSSTPPGAVQTSPSAPSAPPPAQFNPLGPPATPGGPPVISTPRGPLVGNGPVGVPGGTSTATDPTNGGTSIVVPNGNGTSTVIGPDGSTQTIPTPR